MGVWLRARAIWRQSSPEIGEDPWTTILEGSQASRRAECPFSHILSYTAYMVPALGYGEEGGNQVVDSVMGNYQIISSIVSFWTCKYTRWPRILTIRKHPKWHIYIYRLKAGGSPELPGTLSLEPVLQTSLWYSQPSPYIYILFYTCLEWFSIRIRRDKVAAQAGPEKLQVLVILVVPQKGRPCEK